MSAGSARRRGCDKSEEAGLPLSGEDAGRASAWRLSLCALEDGARADELFAQYGDLVAIGTVADVVPVLGKTAHLYAAGLHRCGKRPGRASKALRGFRHRSEKITSSGIGFTLAPRLNAAGRLGQTMRAVELLLTENEDEAEIMASEMCELNRERQTLEGKIFEEAAVMLADDRDSKDPIVLAGGDVASRRYRHCGLAPGGTAPAGPP